MNPVWISLSRCLSGFMSRQRHLYLSLGIVCVLLTSVAAHAGILDLDWIAPTTNADSTSLTDLSGYNVYWGTSSLTTCPPASPPQFVAAARPDPQSSTLVTSQLTGLTTGTIYFVRVTAVDTSSNESVCSVEASNSARPDPADTTPPTVSLTAPTAGASLRGTLTVSATASDNVGVVGVQFQLDGANLGAEDTTSPYSVSWNTTAASNGPHTLTAVARDAAGNPTTSSAVAVTVDNSAPTVSLTAPTAGATVSGTVTVSATASDNVGVVGVQFRLDGVNLGAEDTTSPYSIAWNTTTTSNGPHSLTAVARDAAGNPTTSSAVAVTVNNTTPPPLAITTTTLPAATVGSAYSQILAATGGATPYTWSLASGTLPAGLSLNGTTGVISGTPTTAGTSSFTVRVTDSAAATATRALTLTVNTPPPPGPGPTADSGGGGGGGCFIATAAYGSALEPQVVLLREFRDRYLVTHTLGQAFVLWYYHVSPPIAETVRLSSTLRGLVRVALWPAVALAWLSLHLGVGVAALGGIGGLAGWGWVRRRARRRAA